MDWIYFLASVIAIGVVLGVLISALYRRFLYWSNEKDFKKQQFIWCLVGNIVQEHLYGINKEPTPGTKHFSPNAKVYCMPEGYQGNEFVKVIGRHRRSGRLIYIVMPSKLITNFRLKKVYDPKVLAFIKSNKIHSWSHRLEAKSRILNILK